MHCVGQMMMVMKMLLGHRGHAKEMLCSSIKLRQLWTGASEGGLGGQDGVNRGWDGTMLGRLHLWMAENGFELKGGGKLPDGRENDLLLTDLALGDQESDERDLIASGSWRSDIWRLSDLLRLDGVTVGKWARSQEGVVRRLVSADGHDAAGWWNILESKLGVSGGKVAQQIGRASCRERV